MLILALDTTSEWGGAAVFRDAECLATAPHAGTPNYSVSLFEDVDRLLHPLRLQLREIDLFAAANGPGSFTGIRVGLAAAQGWAHAFGKSARGVSVLEAMAEEAQAETPYAFSLLDARRGEFYARIFRRFESIQTPSEGQPHPRAFRFAPSGEGVLLRPERIAPFLEAYIPAGEDCTIVAREPDTPAHTIRQTIPPRLPWKLISGFLVPSIARLSFLSFQQGTPPRPEDLSGSYMRRSDAEQNWKE